MWKIEVNNNITISPITFEERICKKCGNPLGCRNNRNRKGFTGLCRHCSGLRQAKLINERRKKHGRNNC